MNQTDERILTGLQNSDQKALKELFDRYYMPLCLYAVQITDSFELAEDVVQEFFVTFWEKKIYKQIDQNLKNYLFYCIRNAALAVMRGKKILLLEEVEEEVYSLPDENYDEEELLKKQHRLFEQLEQLPEQAYKVFDGIIIHKKKYKEVAEELGISVNSVKTQLSRAMKRLRSSMNLIFFLYYKIR